MVFFYRNFSTTKGNKYNHQHGICRTYGFRSLLLLISTNQTNCLVVASNFFFIDNNYRVLERKSKCIHHNEVWCVCARASKECTNSHIMECVHSAMQCNAMHLLICSPKQTQPVITCIGRFHFGKCFVSLLNL